ncbi:cytochrome P450 [Catenuloplanes nepalensis]|uniref:Cytochrome P450 n=1 Tax=Catenuloplanes nepalensis TaxID=587533 RepID=A0ABT9MUA8_9ACTN|nr:cytochrome P450 [Catenuloplanes nepalensis]MDP9794985.1 cytochrome P450 [Catenuloplanes nepalensis]
MTTATRTVDDLTGPRPLPIVGNLVQMRTDRDGHRAYDRWAREYGPTYLLRFGKLPIVVTGDGPIVEAVLRDRPDGFTRTRVGPVLEGLGVHGVFSAEGARWRRLRKMAAQSLNAAYLREYFTTITRSSGRLRARWAHAAGENRPVDVLDDMMRFTLEVTTALAIGHDLDAFAGDTGLHRRLAELFPEIGRRLYAPVPLHNWITLPRDRRRARVMREVDALVRSSYRQAKDRMATGAKPRTFLEALVAPLAGEAEFSHGELFGNVLTMLLAGQDTTSSAAAWTLHHLARHPEAQQRVREEATAAFGPDGTPADPGALRALPFTDAVIQETMRLRPVAPVMGFRPTRDTVLPGSGYDLRLPAGQSILLLLSHGARAVDAPDEFRPDRWLGDNPPAPAPLHPFGAGPRFCPGRNLALLETALVAGLLCRDFQLTPDGGPVGERLAFTAFPTDLRLRLTPLR